MYFQNPKYLFSLFVYLHYLLTFRTLPRPGKSHLRAREEKAVVRSLRLRTID